MGSIRTDRDTSSTASTTSSVSLSALSLTSSPVLETAPSAPPTEFNHAVDALMEWTSELHLDLTDVTDASIRHPQYFSFPSAIELDQVVARGAGPQSGDSERGLADIVLAHLADKYSPSDLLSISLQYADPDSSFQPISVNFTVPLVSTVFDYLS